MSFIGRSGRRGIGGLRPIAYLCAVGALLSGCGGAAYQVSQEEVDAYLADKPVEMHSMLTAVVANPPEDRVVHQMRAGLAAMEAEHDALAGALFDDALLTIEAVYGGDERAEEARSMFSAEDSKVFRGEPYERAMAYYYRGILDLKAGDYENARASFRSGSLQDTLAAQEEYQADFSLLDFLDGWASQCNGNRELAAESFEIATMRNDDLQRPDPDDTVLVLADLGNGPVKHADGEYGELLRLEPGSNPVAVSVSVRSEEGATALPNQESIAWQATTRGGRAFDHILANKATFKEDMADTAEVSAAMALATAEMSSTYSAMGDHDSGMAAAGASLVMGLIAIGSSIASEATEAAADTRQWDNLPDRVVYGTFNADEVSSSSQIEIAGAASAGVRTGGSACTIYWLRAPATSLGNES